MSACVETRDRSVPQISVVIPAYRCARYLSETLESVFAQTFTSYEVFLVNDGSPDTNEIERIIKLFPNRLVYIAQENRGASAARNTGIRKARGEFIAFLDGDDKWLPHYLAEQMKFISEHECDLVCADAEMFGDEMSATRSYMDWLMASAPPRGAVSFVDLISGRISLITSGVVVRRASLTAVGLFDETIRRAQDFDLWLKLARHGARLMYWRNLLLCYRRHAEGLTGDAINTITREVEVLHKVETSYRLTAAERAELLPEIRRRKAVLNFELGKHFLAKGDIVAARDVFSRACEDDRNLKRQLAVWLTHIAPNPMHAIYRRRLQRAHAK